MVHLERLIAILTSSHPSSMNFMERNRGKMRSRLKAIADADPSGTGISPTSISVKAQSVHRVVNSALEVIPGLASGALRLANWKCTRRAEMLGQWCARARSPFAVTPVVVWRHGALPSLKYFNFGIARERSMTMSSSTLEEHPRWQENLISRSTSCVNGRREE